MSSTEANTDTKSILYRPIEKHEQQQALDLWYTTFTQRPGFFERYFNEETAPHYQQGDTIGVWVNGKLVSALHIRRIYIRSRDDNIEYLCGAIANVATLEEYRKHGYSRELLRMAIKKMEESNEFDLSILGTGRPNHYAALGWEQISVPSPVTVQWNHFSSSADQYHWHSPNEILPSNSKLLLDIHSIKPRTYQFSRSPAVMFQHWTGWIWTNDKAIIHLLGDGQQGYVVITKADDPDEVYVSEWRAVNVTLEKRLLKLAANEIRRRHPQTRTIRFHTAPQYISLEEFDEWAGDLTVTKNDHMMIRNIRLSNEILEKIKAAYTSGHATFWRGDHF